jgi:multidrug resistance efflux pump
MMRVLITLVTLGSVAAAAMWLHKQSLPQARPAQPAASSEGPRMIYAPGAVEGASEQVELRLELPGRIVEVLVKEGDFVERGTLLVRLDDATYRQQIELLKAEHQVIQAELVRLRNGAHQHERMEAAQMLQARQERLKHAQRELVRSKKLLDTRSTSEQEVARWEAEVKALMAEVRAAQARHDFLDAPAREDEIKAIEAKATVVEARLDLAETELAKTLLHAPSSGQVLELNREPGELIDLDDPQPTIVLADTRRLRVRAYVEELDAMHVRAGMTAYITADGLPGQRIAGRVLQVLPRMSFKQVWTDRPDERFNVKSREVLIELSQPSSIPASTDVVTPINPPDLVFGLIVEVEIDPTIKAPPLRQAASAER